MKEVPTLTGYEIAQLAEGVVPLDLDSGNILRLHAKHRTDQAVGVRRQREQKTEPYTPSVRVRRYQPLSYHYTGANPGNTHAHCFHSLPVNHSAR